MKILIPLLLLTLGVKGNGIIDDLLTSREWTSADGKPLKAELISADDKLLELKRSSDRRVFKIPLNKISEDDQKLVAAAKAQLIKSAKIFDKTYEVNSTEGVPRERRAKLFIKNTQLRKGLTKPEYWELARRLGILEQISDSLPREPASPSALYLESLSLPIDSIALASGVGKLGETGSSKGFLLKSGNIFIRINGDNYRQKGQKIVRMNGDSVRTTSKAGSTVRNEIAWDYNDFNQPVTEYQEHGGAVNTSTSLKVTYGYESGAANTIRRKSMKYPHSGGGSARTLHLDYISEQAKAISRFDELRIDSTKEATFKYVGLGMPVEQKLPNASDVFLTLGDSSDHYAGYDRFGRLVETQWKNGISHLVHSTYGRNRHSGVDWRRDEEAHDLSVDTQDTYYKYDGLQQVTSHQRGDLIPGDTPPFTGIDSGTREQSETFSYDRMGNWLGYTSQTPSLTQTRTHNKDNEIASLTNPSGVVQPAYDAAGNMTEMPSPDDWTNAYTCTWDAWNRLVEVKDGTTTVATYRYDGQTRRITKELASESRSYYFNNQWRALEERVSGIIDKDYVWNPANRWNLIQYRYSDSTTLDTVRYVLKDGLDPVAVIDSSGTVKERAFYEAFGPVTFMDANFANESSSSGEEWTFLFHGELIDTETGLYNYGYRYYHPQLGRWTIKDPIGERGGINLYAMVGNNPASVFDSFGKVPVGVNYTPPCPHCLVPKEGNALQVSHTNYPKNKQKCSCKCVCPDEETGDWFIECEVSFEAEIFLSSKELGINGATWSTIYGHEQQHIVSRTGLVQKVVEEMEAKNGGPFSSSSKCDRSRREWQFDLCNKFRDQLDPKKNPPHRGDVGQDDQEAAHDAPGNGEPIPPLPGTHEDIVSGLEYLETIGYGE